eukprot:TRINITY_DN2648_c0_g1_i2.p1 TRINITY_DN2648_c0_g1~~TRINITY_DN2648_c0_g1_i2.p1  ORF type:complete len:737 (+),score=91.23 TRINITY_DN2648_c0_g1_i2:1618-3828(+)
MLEKVRQLNRECYKHQLQLISSLHTINVLADNKGKPANRVLCANEKEYMAGTAPFFMHLLLMLKDDKKLFAFFIATIEQDQTFDESYLETLAGDLIGLFFSDFTSNERSICNALRQFDELLRINEISYKGNWFNAPLFVNRLIEAYLNRIENREYLTILFGEIVADSILVEKVPIKDKSARKSLSVISNSLPETKSLETMSLPKTSALLDTSVSLEEEKEVLTEEVNPSEQTFKVCDEIIRSITKNLIYMPISIRYLCKLLQKLCEESEPSLVQKVIMDLLYQKWWKYALSHPNKYRITKVSVPYSSNNLPPTHINTTLDLLENVLYARKVPETINSFTELNAYIESKRAIVEKYIADLLNIDLPSMDLPEAEDNSLVISSVCISIQNLKLIYETLLSRISEVSAIKETCTKYINRIKFIMENPSGMEVFPPIFMPTEDRFKAEPPSNREEFVSSSHYIMFQDVSVREKKREQILSEKWQQALHKLLLEIDLTGYYNESGVALKGNEECVYEISILKLLRELYEYPNGFMANAGNKTKVKLLAGDLLNYFEERDEKSARESMESLKDTYMKTVAVTLDKQQKVEYCLRQAINSLKSRIGKTEESCNQIQDTIISGIYADHFITKFVFTFEIKKEIPPTPKDKKGTSEAIYTVSLSEAKAKPVTARGIAGVMFLGGLQDLHQQAAQYKSKHIKEYIGYLVLQITIASLKSTPNSRKSRIFCTQAKTSVKLCQYFTTL